MWLYTLVLIFLTYLFLKIYNQLFFWKKEGIPYITPWPVIGSFKDVVLKQKNVAYVFEDLYNNYRSKRYYGMYNFTKPSLAIRDLDLIKLMTIKDFDHFTDHIVFSDSDTEPLMTKNLLFLSGQKWREMRLTLSPSFTGNKIRGMFHLMADCAKQFNQHFLNQTEEIIKVEMKDLMGRFANDIIATCAFGVKCDSINDKDSIFYKMGKSILSNTAAGWIRTFIAMLMPKIAKKFQISMLPKEVTTFFDNAIRETLRLRAENNIIRPDMIHLLMEAKKERESTEESDEIPKKEELTIEDIVAQAFVFFLAGFETISTVLSHALHELAVNEEVQKKLQGEIDEAFGKSNDDISYETLNNMKYLDMVISETLRKWPAAVGLNRMCVKDYQIDGSVEHGEKPYLLKAGISIFIPSYGIQRDPQYFPNPDKFDPERFSEENKHKIVPYSYMPFGLGPRNCIGSRFALLEAKVLLTYLLSKFSIVPTADTIIPLVLASDNSQICPKGFWLGLKKRNLK